MWLTSGQAVVVTLVGLDHSRCADRAHSPGGSGERSVVAFCASSQSSSGGFGRRARPSAHWNACPAPTGCRASPMKGWWFSDVGLIAGRCCCGFRTQGPHPLRAPSPGSSVTTRLPHPRGGLLADGASKLAPPEPTPAPDHPKRRQHPCIGPSPDRARTHREQFRYDPRREDFASSNS